MVERRGSTPLHPTKVRLLYSHHIMNISNIILRDGFIFMKVNDKAKEIWNSGLFELYAVYSDDNSESLIETFEDLDMYLSNGMDVCIEVGFIPKKNHEN